VLFKTNVVTTEQSIDAFVTERLNLNNKNLKLVQVPHKENNF